MCGSVAVVTDCVRNEDGEFTTDYVCWEIRQVSAQNGTAEQGSVVDVFHLVQSLKHIQDRIMTRHHNLIYQPYLGGTLRTTSMSARIGTASINDHSSGIGTSKLIHSHCKHAS
jgi:hypothetical protein